MSNPAGSKDLHGNAPDNAPVALLIIDAINDLAFEEGREVLGKAIRMAHKIRLLKARARRVGIPHVDGGAFAPRYRHAIRLTSGRSRQTGSSMRRARLSRSEATEDVARRCRAPVASQIMGSSSDA